MVQPAVEEPVTSENASQLLDAFRWMLLARITEEKLASLYRGGKITGGVYLSTGQEAVSAALGVALRAGDVFAPLIRDMAGRLAFGEPLIDVFRTYLGSRQGPMLGRDGNIHRGRPQAGQLAMISHLGAMIPVVAGSLLARRLKGDRRNSVGATCLGDGGTSTGAFHEGINLAAVERLPLVLVVTNNQFAYSTPNNRQFACENLADRAAGYGIEGCRIDGTKLEECVAAISAAVARARNGAGPQLVVATILRLGGHGEHDDASYIPKTLKQSALGSDCLGLAEQYFIEQDLASPARLAEWRSDAHDQVEKTVAVVQQEAAPDPSQENWRALKTVFLSGANPGTA